ncbi:MAG: N-acetylmuramidase family protein [Odoribacter sp.]|nr:N-acetylmuramidase family protein [Odoribacter sp.]
MKNRHTLPAIALLVICVTACVTKSPRATAQLLITQPPDSITYVDPDREYFVMGNDTVHLRFTNADDKHRHGPLTDRDIEEFAAELGVETAAIRAVIDIETGKTHKGFWTEGKPVINFDLSVFRQMAKRHGINLSRYTKSHSEVFNKPNISRHGSQQAAVQARLDRALDIDTVAAIEGTFWGMFQIGGFNWRQCGTTSPQEFMQLMSRSERDQLELFGEFITRSGLLPALKAKNWSAFARGYNGPGYAARGYHTRLATAYKKYKHKRT